MLKYKVGQIATIKVPIIKVTTRGDPYPYLVKIDDKEVWIPEKNILAIDPEPLIVGDSVVLKNCIDSTVYKILAIVDDECWLEWTNPETKDGQTLTYIQRFTDKTSYFERAE